MNFIDTFYLDIIRFKNDVLFKWLLYIVIVVVWGFFREFSIGVESYIVNVLFFFSRGFILSFSRVK